MERVGKLMSKVVNLNKGRIKATLDELNECFTDTMDREDAVVAALDLYTTMVKLSMAYEADIKGVPVAFEYPLGSINYQIKIKGE
jgi:hypothetical protein